MTIHHGGNFLQDNLKEEKLNDFSPKVGLKWPNREKQFKEFKSFDVETKFSIFCYKLSQCTSSPMKFMLLHHIFGLQEFSYFNWGVLVQNFQIFLRYDDTYLVLHIIFEIFSRLVETFWLGILLLFFLILVAKMDFNTHKRVV